MKTNGERAALELIIMHRISTSLIKANEAKRKIENLIKFHQIICNVY